MYYILTVFLRLCLTFSFDSSDTSCQPLKKTVCVCNDIDTHARMLLLKLLTPCWNHFLAMVLSLSIITILYNDSSFSHNFGYLDIAGHEPQNKIKVLIPKRLVCFKF